MRIPQRRQLVLAEVMAGNGDVEELSQRLGVSPSTIRRDLQQLVDGGQVTRTYGGAVPGLGSVELSLKEKEATHAPEKEAIAAAASELVSDGETVILDAGTTTARLAVRLRERRNMTVITNGLNTILKLYESDDVELIVLGGSLRQITQSTVGSMAEANLRRLFADKAFLGADGLMATEGVSSPTMQQSFLKQLMLERAREAYVLADHSKLCRKAYAHVTRIERPYTLITDSRSPVTALRPFLEDEFATVLTAPVGRRHGRVTAGDRCTSCNPGGDNDEAEG